MTEEVPQPHINIPNAMLLAVVVGAGSSFIFLMVLLFCMTNIDAVIESSAGSLIAAMQQSTNSTAGAICLAVFPIISMEFAAQGMCVTTTSSSHQGCY
jgi:choline transport protein